MGIFRQIHRKTHDNAVFGRRIEVLARRLADFIPEGARVLTAFSRDLIEIG